MTPTDLAQYRATYDPEAWAASIAQDPGTDGRVQILVGAALAVRALCSEVERLQAKYGPPPVVPYLDLARQVAPELEWQDSRHDAWAELPTGRAIASDGYVVVGNRWVHAFVGGYKLRRNITQPLTVAGARHVLHDHAQRLARSTLDFRRTAGLAILTGMEAR
jgi:hypothetical protein